MGEWNAIEVKEFDLDRTLRSGQFFRYYEENGSFILVTQRKVIELREKDNIIYFKGVDEASVKELLGITSGHDEKINELLQDSVIRNIVMRYKGLRIMKQDLHETIIGFICSSVSNIPKIRMNLHLISQSCGEKVGEHAFLPEAGKELDHQMIWDAKTGYRAKFIVQTNRMLSRKMLDEIRAADYQKSHELLMRLPGVGPKVADCICLYALGHGEAFPVDVHILRAMRVLFPRNKLTSEKRAKYFAQQRWGKNAGLAQQFIFEWARENIDPDVERNIQKRRKVREIIASS